MSNDKIYLPSCKECKSILTFKIQPLNFSIDYECENNKNHNKNNIYFKTFERFYLREKNLISCSKCHIILENNQFFECKKCKFIFCSDCYIEEKNNHKNIRNNNNNICLIHNIAFTFYCFYCSKNICIFCLKNSEHMGHETQSFVDIMPSSVDIENLKDRLKQKKYFTHSLIEKIDNWQKNINRKVEELKQNLIDEIDLFDKIILNFNNNFINYTYFQNFNYINKNILNTSNNQYLIQFFNTENFENQTKLLITIFKNIGKKIETFKEENKKESIINIKDQIKFSLVEKIDNFNFVCYLTNNIHLIYYNKNENRIFSSTKIIFNENIYSISPSNVENKIFISLLNQKRIKIIDYDIYKNILILNNKEISLNNNNSYFYKCIQLSKELFATSDNQNIIIWKDNIFNFIQIKNFLLNSSTLDMMLIDNENFISSQPDQKALRIFEIKQYEQIKIINNIDCIRNSNSLIKINDKYIIINCFEGIGIFNIKTKEIIQYIQKFSLLSDNQKICYDNQENIYILNIENENNSNINNSNLFIFGINSDRKKLDNYKIRKIKTKIEKGSFEKIKDYEIFNSSEDINNVIYHFTDNLLLFGNNGNNFKISYKIDINCFWS